jgi:hypothetical protein
MLNTKRSVNVRQQRLCKIQYDNAKFCTDISCAVMAAAKQHPLQMSSISHSDCIIALIALADILQLVELQPLCTEQLQHIRNAHGLHFCAIVVLDNMHMRSSNHLL